MPGLGASFMRSSPARTMKRFSSSSGTTSATVDSAARSTYSMAAARPESASTSLKATPAPERCGQG